MTDRQRRIAKLVDDIRAALDRGVSPETIHETLVRRKLPPGKATLLLRRIQAQRAVDAPHGSRPTAPPGRVATTSPAVAAPPDVAPAGVVPDPPRPIRRRRRGPFFLALAIILIAGGFTGVVLNSRAEAEEQERVRASRTVADRLEREIAAARDQLDHIDGRLDERRVDAEQIEWLRARVARGPDSFETLADYEDMYGIYERRRARWNRTLPQYTVVSDAYRTLADIYNAKLDTLKAMGLAPQAGSGEDGSRKYVRIAAVSAPLE